MARKLPAETIATFLGRLPLLGGCELEELLELAATADHQAHPARSLILQPGRPTSSLGLLLKGRATLAIVDAASGSQSRLEQLMPGDVFGEVGILLGSGAPLAVIAEEDCESLSLPKAAVEALLKRRPGASLALAKRVAQRLVQLGLLGLRAAEPAVREPPAREPEPAPAPEARPAPREPAPAHDPGAIRWVEVSSYPLTPEVLGVVPSPLIRKHRLLPLQVSGSRLVVGMVNPRSAEALQDLRRVLHTMDPEVVAISADDFNQTFVRLKLDAAAPAGPQASAQRAQQLSYAIDQQREAEKSQLVIGGEVIGLFDRILTEALDRGASDIHIEPDATGVKVRYRVHGTLVDRAEMIPASFASPLIARVKVLGELDITEHRLPQDGRIGAQLGRRDLNLRLSTMPVSRGEKAVIRVIDPADVMRPLHQIFLHPDLEKAVRAALADPYGAIVVAGPTGSGKSSSLYSMLNERRTARPDNAIVTVEDPVEYLVQGVTQVPIQPRVGFGFGVALRGLMRQDPDVIMIGELRDSETTTIMVEAALTGHLVLTSIHGNNAAAVIQRLQHLGTDPVLLSQALSIIVVQRLAKRLCPSCAVDAEVAPALLENLAARRIIARSSATKLPRPVGCPACHKTGYAGRIAVQEVLHLDDEIRVALASRATPAELIEKARERKRFASFAQSAAFFMARRLLAPADVLMVVAD